MSKTLNEDASALLPPESLPAMGRLSQRFADRALEGSFQAHHAAKTRTMARAAILVGVILFGFFGVLDAVMAPEHREALWAIRYGLVCPMGIVLLVFSYSRWGRDRLQVLTGSVVTLAGLGGVAMTTLVNPEVTQTYYLGLILTMLFGFTVAQMRWRAANAMAGTIVLAYELVALDSLPTLQLIHNNFYLLAGVIIGLIACWQTERFHRREFLQLREIDAQRTALADANDRLEAEASRDPLTGLQNRRHLTERILEAAGMAERYGIPTTLVLMDMDRFKRVNDTFGHPVGDALLRTVARTLASTVRDTDRLFRIGGDEFLVLLLGTPLETAYGAVARMEAILDGVFQVGPWSELGLGVSTGIVLVDPKLTPEKNVEAADRSMYTVKTPEER